MKNGDVFGRWVVIDDRKTSREDGYKVMCRCVCGTERPVVSKYLRNGLSKSCGCNGLYPGVEVAGHTLIERRGRELLLRCEHGLEFTSRSAGGGIRKTTCPCLRDYGKHAKHGESVHSRRTGEYNVWRMMRQRCNSSDHKSYADYGGRGIKICERWNDFAAFLADMGRRPKGYTIERVDVNGNYEPSNCVWAPMSVQHRNKRASIYLTANGKRLHLKEWAEATGISYSCLYQRLKYGWSPEEVVAP